MWELTFLPREQKINSQKTFWDPAWILTQNFLNIQFTEFSLVIYKIFLRMFFVNPFVTFLTKISLYLLSSTVSNIKPLHNVRDYKMSPHAHTSCWYRNPSGVTCATSFITATLNINPDGVVCVALEVGQGGTGCCCIVHCVCHQRASLGLVVNSNKVNTHG